MSSSRGSKRKNRSRIVNKGTLFEGNLIQCIEDKNYLQEIEAMKNGYIEMGKINLQLASDNESELVDINNYETWLCGV